MAAYSLIPGDLHEGLGAGVQDLGKGAEMLDHPLGQGLDVGVGDGEGQEQFQELIVLQGPGASRQEAASQAGAVAVVMRFCRFFHHLIFSFTPEGLKCNRENRDMPVLKAGCAALSRPIIRSVFWGSF